jgi:hypothetical protein
VRRSELTPEQVGEIVDTATGYATGFESVLRKYEGLTADELEELLLDNNVERCPGCDWYCESGELLDDEDNLVGCRDCRPPEPEE